MNWDWEKLREKQNQYKQKKEGEDGFQRPPQFDELFNKFKKINFKFNIFFIIILVLFVLFIGKSTFFQIDLDEVGVIQRFGKFSRIVQPGLNFKLPAGIEKLTKVRIKRIYKEEFGFNTPQKDSKYVFSNKDIDEEVSLMLTGDLNVAIVPWIVQFRISDPYKYLFKVKDVKGLLRDMSEATMRTVVGDRSINEIISKRNEISIAAKNRLQREMDEAETGIAIVTIEMQKTNVPGPVQQSFNEVNEAIQEKEQLIYKAKEAYNKAVPLAKGEAKRIIKDAEGYAVDRVNSAKGDAAKFNAIYNEYAKAKTVTKKRLYLEAMAEILPKIGNKYFIDSNQKNLIPLLNINKNNTMPLSTEKQLNKNNGVK